MPNRKPSNDKETFAHLFYKLGVTYDTWFNADSSEQIMSLVPFTHRKVEGDLTAEIEIVFDGEGNFLRFNAITVEA